VTAPGPTAPPAPALRARSSGMPVAVARHGCHRCGPCSGGGSGGVGCIGCRERTAYGRERGDGKKWVAIEGWTSATTSAQELVSVGTVGSCISCSVARKLVSCISLPTLRSGFEVHKKLEVRSCLDSRHILLIFQNIHKNQSVFLCAHICMYFLD
jgi:hypothetical protein